MGPERNTLWPGAIKSIGYFSAALPLSRKKHGLPKPLANQSLTEDRGLIHWDELFLALDFAPVLVKFHSWLLERPGIQVTRRLYHMKLEK